MPAGRIKVSVIVLIAAGVTAVFIFRGHSVSRSDSNRHPHVTMVSAVPVTATEYYAGLIQPVRLATVVSPVDGVIDPPGFHYGEPVTRNKMLASIDSDKFYESYKTVLMQYIRARSDFSAKENQKKEGEFLHSMQMISEDEYNAKKTDFYSAYLEYVQSRIALGSLMSQFDLDPVKFQSLRLSDIGKIRRILQSGNKFRHLRMRSPSDGIVLQPDSPDAGGGEFKSLSPGDRVKPGDVLAVIADPGRWMVNIRVSEFNVSHLRLRQPVSVTGAAFPGIVLKGHIASISHQGQTGQSGIPGYAVSVLINTLTPGQASLISAGMSAKVAVEIDLGQKITVPIAAVTEREGGFYVKVFDPDTSKIREVPVVPGRTLPDAVVVESTLVKGDRVVVPG